MDFQDDSVGSDRFGCQGQRTDDIRLAGSERRIDDDGNMTDGVRHPNLAVPIGTHTGWNLRRDGFAPQQQCAGTGSYFPFELTASDRTSTGDPRLSFEERYTDHAGYVAAIQVAADQLVDERLLLAEHAELIVERAAASRVRTQN